MLEVGGVTAHSPPPPKHTVFLKTKPDLYALNVMHDYEMPNGENKLIPFIDHERELGRNKLGRTKCL